MNSLVLILITIVIFIIAYSTYGSWLCRKWGIDPKKTTPAHTNEDGVDYVPAKAPVLLGHHFSSIAGAGPIVGPIAAAVFGWLPVMLWIIIGSIFFGGVHDMGALFASVRHGGKSVGEVIHANMGNTGKKLFSWFAWLTLLLVIAAFTSVCAKTFAYISGDASTLINASVATSSMLFMILAIIFGLLVYRRGAGLGVSSIIGVILLFLCIWLGLKFPVLKFGYNTWVFIILIYIAIASVTPVWILLQPRDYLNSFLLYAMLIGGVIGLIIKHPSIELAPVTSFNLGNYNLLFPMLFVTVACGAISGFHSLVASGTTSKQIDNEKDIKLVGYGSMLIEGVLAVIAIITVAYISKDGTIQGSPLQAFAAGLGNFMNGFGLPVEIGISFTTLAISAFALTSLDTATRLGRFIFQEMISAKKENTIANVLSNKYCATIITVVLGGILTFAGYEKIWPIFGSANQLLAALALLALAVFLKKQGKEHRMAIIPTIFMFIVTLTALVLLIIGRSQQFAENWLLVIIACILVVLSIILIINGIKSIRSKDINKKDEKVEV